MNEKRFVFSSWTEQRIKEAIKELRAMDRSELTDWHKLLLSELLEEAHLRRLTV